MKRLGTILAVSALLFSNISWASEDVDPFAYPEVGVYNYGEETAADPLSAPNIAAAPAAPVIHGELQNGIINTKVMDDSDLDFDSLDIDALANETPEPTPPAAVEKKAEVTPPPPSDAVQTPMPAVDPGKTLTDNLKENNPSDTGDSVIPMPKDTWISKLKAPLTGGDDETDKKVPSGANLEKMVEQAKKKTVRRSNASVFDISGAMLRMSFEQIDDILIRRGYRRTMQKFDIPNFIRWRNEDKCRASGVVGYERLENCVIQMAKKNKHQFIERALYSKYPTREEIEVRFTSTFTNNKAYRIAYKSEAAIQITGSGPKATYLRNIKVFDFWKKINQKYGIPDNKDDVIWGLGGNKPYLQAGTGRLILEDPMLRELDYTRMSREDQKFMNTDLYSF